MVNSLSLNWSPTGGDRERAEVSLFWGARYASEAFGGDDVEGLSNMVGADVRFDLGDMFDIGFKANIRNLALLDGYLQHPAEVRRSSRRFVAALVVGLLLLTAAAIALAVVLVRLISGLFQ